MHRFKGVQVRPLSLYEILLSPNHYGLNYRLETVLRAAFFYVVQYEYSVLNGEVLSSANLFMKRAQQGMYFTMCVKHLHTDGTYECLLQDIKWRSRCSTGLPDNFNPSAS